MNMEFLSFVIISILILFATGHDGNSSYNGKHQNFQFPNQNTNQKRNPYQNHWNYNTEKRNETHLPQGKYDPKDVYMSEVQQAETHQTRKQPGDQMEIQYTGRSGAWKSNNGIEVTRNGHRSRNNQLSVDNKQQQMQGHGGNWGPVPRNQYIEQYGNYPNGYNPNYNNGNPHNGHQAYNQYTSVGSSMINGAFPARIPMHSGMIDPDLPDGLDDLWEMQQRQNAMKHLMKTNPGLAVGGQQYRGQQNAQNRGPDKGSDTSGSGRVRIWNNPTTSQHQGPGSTFEQDNFRHAPMPRNFEEKPVEVERKEYIQSNTSQRQPRDKQYIQNQYYALSNPYTQLNEENKTNILEPQIKREQVPEQSHYRSRWYRKRGRNNRVNEATSQQLVANKSEQASVLNIKHQPSAYEYEKFDNQRYRSLSHETTSPIYQKQPQLYPQGEKYEDKSNYHRQIGRGSEQNRYNQYYKYPADRHVQQKATVWDPRQKPPMSEFDERFSQQLRMQTGYNDGDQMNPVSGRRYNQRTFESDDNGYQNRNWHDRSQSQQKTQRNQEYNSRAKEYNNVQQREMEHEQDRENRQSLSSRQQQSVDKINLQNQRLNDMLLQELITNRLKQRNIGQARNGTMPWDPVQEGGTRSTYRYHDRDQEQEIERERDNRKNSFSMSDQYLYGQNSGTGRPAGTILEEMISEGIKQRRIRQQTNETLPRSSVQGGGIRQRGFYKQSDIDNEDDRERGRGSPTHSSEDTSRNVPNRLRMLNEYIAQRIKQESGNSKVNQTRIRSITGRKVWLDPAYQKEIDTGRISLSLLDEIIDRLVLGKVDEIETQYGKIEREENGGYEIEGPLFRMILAKTRAGKPKTAKELERMRKLAGFDLPQNSTTQNETASLFPDEPRHPLSNNPINKRHQAIWDSLSPSRNKGSVSGRQVWSTMNPKMSNPWDQVHASAKLPDSPWDVVRPQQEHNPLFESKISSNRKNSSNLALSGISNQTMSEISADASKLVPIQKSTTTSPSNMKPAKAKSLTEQTHIVFEEPLSLNKTKPVAARMVWVPNEHKETANNTDSAYADNEAKQTLATESGVSEFGIIIAIFAALGVLGAPVLCIVWRIHKQHQEKKRKQMKETENSDDKFELEAMISHDFGKCDYSKSDKGARRKTYFNNPKEMNHIQELKPLNSSGRVSPTVIVHQENEIY